MKPKKKEEKHLSTVQVSRFAAMSKFARAAMNMFARLAPDEEVEDIRAM